MAPEVDAPKIIPVAPTQPVAPAPGSRWYGPLLAGDLAALWPAIVIAFIGVLVIAFGMSFHGLYVFGERIMGWFVGLCIAGPIGLDVFSLVCLIGTFLTRDAAWRVRLYCWVALLGTVAVSIGGNAISAYSLLDADAARRGVEFVWGYRQVSAVAGAAFWPALSAIALHVLIVVRRHLDERRDKIKTAVAEARAEQDAETLLQAQALTLVAEGASVSDVLDQLGLDESRRRAVERWTKPVRDALTVPKTAVATKIPARRVTARPAATDTPNGAATA